MIQKPVLEDVLTRAAFNKRILDLVKKREDGARFLVALTNDLQLYLSDTIIRKEPVDETREPEIADEPPIMGKDVSSQVPYARERLATLFEAYKGPLSGLDMIGIVWCEHHPHDREIYEHMKDDMERTMQVSDTLAEMVGMLTLTDALMLNIIKNKYPHAVSMDVLFSSDDPSSVYVAMCEQTGRPTTPEEIHKFSFVYSMGVFKNIAKATEYTGQFYAGARCILDLERNQVTWLPGSS